MKSFYKKMIWYIIGRLEEKMDKTKDFKRANRLFYKMEQLKAIAYDL